MQRLGEDPEAVRADHQKGFQAKQQGGGANAQQGGALLFLDGGMQDSGKEHGLRLQQVARGCRAAVTTYPAESEVCSRREDTAGIDSSEVKTFSRGRSGERRRSWRSAGRWAAGR